MITYEKSCWPNEDVPSEIYLYPKRDGVDLGRIVIFKDRIDGEDLNIIAKNSKEVEEWIGILTLAWQMKILQDKKGWSEK